MSERLTALGMGVLLSWFVFLAVHSVGRADESSKEEAAGVAKASEEVTAAKSSSAAAENLVKKGETCPEARIRAALDRPIAVKFIETPLEDVVACLSKYQIPAILDRRALDEMGIGSDVPVTRCVKGVRLAKLLDLVLGDLDMTWVIHEGVLLITTQEQAECMLKTRVLDVADLAGGEKEVDRLASLIRTVVQPQTWGPAGGPGSIGCVETAEVRALVISQTPGTHDEITRLVADLRNGLGEASTEPRSATSVAGAHIEKVLAEKATMEFVETPLADVIAKLKETLRIEIQIDRRSLDEMGIGVDTPITFSLSGVSAESALSLLLRDLDLTFMIKGDVLLILTKEAEQCNLQTKVYRVGDLLNEDPQALETLATMIRTTTVPTTWDKAGGPASMVPFRNAGLNVLVVSQTWRVHRELGRLFEGLRSVRHESRSKPANEDAKK